MATTIEKKVDHICDEVAQMRGHWELVDALMGGTTAMRRAGRRFMTRWPSESNQHYESRLSSAVLFPAFEDTVEKLSAKPFSRPAAFDPAPREKMATWIEDIDRQGTKLAQFAREQLVGALSRGLVGFMVDMPPRPPGAGTTQADDDRHNIRPYFTPIAATQLLGWKTKNVNGRIILTQLRWKEEAKEDDGEFGTKCIEQIRVAEIGRVRVFRRAEKSDGSGGRGEWAEQPDLSSNIVGLDYIPFFPTYGRRTGFLTARPPLLHLAHQNVKHWNSQSDQDTILHIARVPIIVATGVDDPKFEVVVSSGTAVKLANPEANIKFVEHTGAAIEAGKVSLDDLKDEMRMTGAQMLLMKPTMATATEVATDSDASTCVLKDIALELQASINAGLRCAAEWAKVPGDIPQVRLFLDFVAATLGEATMGTLVAMNTANKLSDESLYHEAQRRGIVDPDRTWEDERDRIEAQGPTMGELEMEDKKRELRGGMKKKPGEEE